MLECCVSVSVNDSDTVIVPAHLVTYQRLLRYSHLHSYGLYWDRYYRWLTRRRYETCTSRDSDSDSNSDSVMHRLVRQRQIRRDAD